MSPILSFHTPLGQSVTSRSNIGEAQRQYWLLKTTETLDIVLDWLFATHLLRMANCLLAVCHSFSGTGDHVRLQIGAAVYRMIRQRITHPDLLELAFADLPSNKCCLTRHSQQPQSVGHANERLFQFSKQLRLPSILLDRSRRRFPPRPTIG